MKKVFQINKRIVRVDTRFALSYMLTYGAELQRKCFPD